MDFIGVEEAVDCLVGIAFVVLDPLLYCFLVDHVREGRGNKLYLPRGHLKGVFQLLFLLFVLFFRRDFLGLYVGHTVVRAVEVANGRVMLPCLRFELV